MFLVVGPLLVVFILTLPAPCHRMKEVAGLLFLLNLPASALAGILDAGLARDYTISVRAALTATGGAIFSCGLVFFLIFFQASPPALALIVMGSGASAGVCSLLANNRRAPVCHGK